MTTTLSSADEIFTKFVNGEKEYGHIGLTRKLTKFVQTINNLKNSVSVCSTKKFQCPKSKVTGNNKDATEILYIICGLKDVKYYQIGELLLVGADPNLLIQTDETEDTCLIRLIKYGGLSNYMS